jgi:hypothetical protein
VTNDAAGIEDLLSRIVPLGPTLIVLEATGGYEAAVTATLANAGLPVVVTNPPGPGTGGALHGRARGYPRQSGAGVLVAPLHGLHVASGDRLDPRRTRHGFVCPRDHQLTRRGRGLRCRLFHAQLLAGRAADPYGARTVSGRLIGPKSRARSGPDRAPTQWTLPILNDAGRLRGVTKRVGMTALNDAECVWMDSDFSA